MTAPTAPVDERTDRTEPTTGTPRRTTGRWVALVIGLAALLVAGMVVNSQSGAPDGTGELVAVSMNEFGYEPASLDLDAGSYTFEITNDGNAIHQWALSQVGEHGDHLADTGELAAGEATTLTVDLPGGVYEFACHVPGHYEAGMHGELAVMGADGTVPDVPAEPAGHDDAPAPGAHDDDAPAHDDAPGAHDDAPAPGGHDDADAAHDDAPADHHDPATDDRAAGAGEVVEVSMTEFAYAPQTLELAAGTYTFEITNDGQVPHEWALAQAGEHHGHGASTRQLASGESQELTVDLAPGEYRYMCHIEGHLEAGMEGTLVVTG